MKIVDHKYAVRRYSGDARIYYIVRVKHYSYVSFNEFSFETGRQAVEFIRSCRATFPDCQIKFLYRKETPITWAIDGYIHGIDDEKQLVLEKPDIVDEIDRAWEEIIG